MNLPVIWSPASREEYAEILQYVDNEFGTDAALKVMDKIEATVEHIAAFPRAYPFSDIRPDIRKAVISRQTSLLYRITETQIQLLHFWDNRQDPRRLEFL
jgi:plasmid stabilization system protein ParE